MNSIVFKAKLFGLFTSFLLCAMAYFALEFVVNYSKAREITKSILLYKDLDKNLLSSQYLKDKNIERISEKEAQYIISKAKFVIETPIYREVFQSGDIVLYLFENYYYYGFRVKNKFYYYKNLEAADNYVLYLFITSVILIFFLFLIYRYIVKALEPLKVLHKKIRALAKNEEHLSIESFSKNTDEVEEVSNAFDEAVSRIESLEETRTLFWRNIMHELKTPLTQGKLLAHVMQAKDDDKEALLRIFDKMQLQLDELKHLEYVKADNVHIKLQNNFLIDIVDNVLDMLELDETQVSVILDAKAYTLNFKLFSIALKNLIANAMYYSSDKKVSIVVKSKHLYIINKGLALKEDFEVYTQAFARDDESKSGMGLGLYISKAIFIKHNISMSHRYLKGNHLLILDMKKALSQ